DRLHVIRGNCHYGRIVLIRFCRRRGFRHFRRRRDTPHRMARLAWSAQADGLQQAVARIYTYFGGGIARTGGLSDIIEVRPKLDRIAPLELGPGVEKTE